MTAASHSPHYRTGVACAIVGATAFSGKSIIIKLAYQYGVDSVTLLMFRMLFALPFFLVIALLTSRGKEALTTQDWLSLLVLAFVGYYIGSFLDFSGLQYITASLGRLIMYLNPTLVLLIGFFVLGKRITVWQVVAMVISYSGIALVFGHEIWLTGAGRTAAGQVGIGLAGNIWLGSAFVLASAFSYAIYLLYSGELVKRLGAIRLASIATSLACVMCIVQFLVLKPLDMALQAAPPVLWLSLLNAIACTVLPVLLVMMAVERIGPALTSQISMIGPIATLAMGVVILDEPLTLWVITGTVLVIGGVWLVTKFGQQKTFITKEQTNV
jgi:drug/metabolite transporter (DMT)-like permease